MNVKEMLQNKKLLAAVAALLVVVILICLVAGGNKAEKTVDNYFKYMQKEKADKLYKTLPKSLRNYLADEDYEEDLMESLEESCEYFADEMDDYKFEVLDVCKLAKDEVEEIEDLLEEISDEADIKLKLQNSKVVIVKGTDEDGYVDVDTVVVTKISGSWVLWNMVTDAWYAMQ